jgi:hypothetical protein
MHDRWRPADGFQILTGIIAVVTGPLLLWHGDPAGWSFMLIAAGIVLLAVQWIIVADLHFAPLDRAMFIEAAVAMTCTAIAIVYLTRAANDLPSLFPGHDGDSENFRIVPGVVALVAASALFTRTAIAARPARHTD